MNQKCFIQVLVKSLNWVYKNLSDARTIVWSLDELSQKNASTKWLGWIT